MSLDKILTDPVRMLSILIALLSYVYFSHLSDIKDKQTTDAARITSLEQAHNRDQQTIFELQATQKSLVGDVADAKARLKDMDKLPLMEQEIGMNRSSIERLQNVKGK